MSPPALSPAQLCDLIKPNLARRVLFAFDFDGTLVSDHLAVADRKLSVQEASALGQLTVVQPVAVITGRSVAATVPVLGFAPTWVVGDHGSEGLPGLEFSVDAHIRAETERVFASWGEQLASRKVFVERKANTYTCHFQDSPEPGLAQELVSQMVRQLPSVWRLFPGRGLVDLLPVGMPDKADAVHHLARACAADMVVFMGDGSNDESVFERAQSHWITVKVGHGAPTSARWRLPQGPSGVHQLVDLIARELAWCPYLANCQ